MGRHTVAVTRTFRVNRDSLDVLEAEAEKESLSVSALLNKILQRYVENTLWGDSYNFINLPSSSFAKLINTLGEKEAFELGRESARGEKENIIDFMWKGKTIDEFLQFIDRNYGTYSGWFRCIYQNNDNKYMVVTTHSFDKNWSYFVAGYIQTLFQAVHDIEMNCKINDNSVTFTFENEKAHDSLGVDAIRK